MQEERAPFSNETQLESGLDALVTYFEKDNQPRSSTHRPDGLGALFLPGHPRIRLDDGERLTTFLIKETCAPDLEIMAPYMWMLSTQSSANVSPIHHQHVKGRQIIVTEDPRLHIVWIYNRIFIKPIPYYLLSHAFWECYLLNPASPLGEYRDLVKRSALGYLRTWIWLIKYESDFVMAQESKPALIPRNMTWYQFSAFLEQISAIADEEVTQRYHYGELRLTRLNFYGKFILRKMHFQKVHGQYGAYFARFYAPIVFFFTVMSLLLNAFQVEMSVEQVLPTDQWLSFWQLARWFSVLSIVVIMILTIGLCMLFVYYMADEWIFAIKVRRKKQREARSKKEDAS